jgi:hypothetical protein
LHAFVIGYLLVPLRDESQLQHPLLHPHVPPLTFFATARAWCVIA